MNEKGNIVILLELIKDLENTVAQYRETRQDLADLVTKLNGIAGEVGIIQEKIDSTMSIVKDEFTVSTIQDFRDQSIGWQDLEESDEGGIVKVSRDELRSIRNK